MSEEKKVKVTEIVDGDTFVGYYADDPFLGEIEKLYFRIAEIDTPEESEPDYEAAKKTLTGLIYDQEVMVKVVGKDRGRFVADVSIKGVDVGTLMVAYDKNKRTFLG